VSQTSSAVTRLTKYFREMLGNPIPPEIYDAVSLFEDGFE
jgi:hypothetical protein